MPIDKTLTLFIIIQLELVDKVNISAAKLLHLLEYVWFFAHLLH